MAVVDRAGLPIAVYTQRASPHEVTLVEATLENRWGQPRPQRVPSAQPLREAFFGILYVKLSNKQRFICLNQEEFLAHRHRADRYEQR